MTPLPVLFATHKGAFLAAGAAGVAGLAMLQRKKSSTTGTSSTSTPAGTIPGAGVISSAGVQSAYPDTSSTAAYNQLEGQLERLQASQAVPVPTPIASSLFAPNLTGRYVRGQDGSIAEIETDGSLYGLTGGDWASIEKSSGGLGSTPLTQLSTALPSFYNVQTNLATAQSKNGTTTP
jgi:hypothetical protein